MTHSGHQLFSTKIDVILCTHNPRADYFSNTLRSLARQTLRADQWRLLLIDSGSDPVLSKHPVLQEFRDSRLNYSVYRENLSGLTRARLRGINESEANMLFFIDDDNVLDIRYLEELLLLSRERPDIGCFGASISAEFEHPPSDGVLPFLPSLALREVHHPIWSNNFDLKTAPYGAGLAVRREVADFYEQSLSDDINRCNLDRSDASLLSCGDIDLAFTSNDLGLGCGLFPQLKLTHLIPKHRLQKSYLKRLAFAAGKSSIMLLTIRNPEKVGPATLIRKIADLVTLQMQSLICRKMRHPEKLAYRKGQIAAVYSYIKQPTHFRKTR